MEIVTIKDVEGLTKNNVLMKTLLEKKGVTLGSAVIPAGTRAPEEGSGVHDADEYSVILKGSLLAGSGNKEDRVSAGQATFIPAGEAHWSINDSDEDCELIWVLVKK